MFRILVLILLAGPVACEAAVLDIVALGADPTGTADCLPLLSNTMDAATAGDTIYFPAGIFRIGDQFIPGYPLELKSGVHLIGAGRDVSILRMDTPPYGNKHRLFATNTAQLTENVRVEGLGFDLDGFAFRLENSRFITIEHCRLTGCVFYVFATLNNGSYGNSDIMLRDLEFLNYDYQDPLVNPAFDPLINYTEGALDSMRYHHQFLLRIMSYPWVPVVGTDAENMDIVVVDCTFTHGAYNAIEVAGGQCHHITVRNSSFSENYGVAIDMDKGAHECRVDSNHIEDMRPTPWYDQGEMYALGNLNGGDVDMASINNRFIGNTFLQHTLPYRKYRSRDGFNTRFVGNTVLPNDAGGDALLITYNDQRSGLAQDSTVVMGNTLGHGAVTFGGTQGGPRIEEALVFRENQQVGAVALFSKEFRSFEVMGNSDWTSTGSEHFRNASTCRVDHLRIAINTFTGAGPGIQVQTPVDTCTASGNNFDGIDQVLITTNAAISVVGNLFSAMSGPVALAVDAPAVLMEDNLFCSNTASQLFAISNCPAVELIDNLEGLNASDQYALFASTVLQETGNYWQGFITQACDLLTGMGDVPVPTIRVFPNPATDFINVVSLRMGAVVRLVDAVGRIAQERIAIGSLVRMDVSTLSAGCYSVQFYAAGQLLGSAVLIRE